MINKKIISIYSGCGGLDLGFKKAGFKTILASDNWDIACNTLKKNKIATEIIYDDIRKIDFSRFNSSVFGLIGGPPCPPYSQTRHYIIGKKNGFNDDKAGFAVPEYFRVLKEINPAFFLFENVDGFMYKTHTDAIQYLERQSAELGYTINYKVLNAANYGIPQTRKRFFCIGFKNDFGIKFNFPQATHSKPDVESKLKQWVTCKDVLSGFDNITSEEKKQKPGCKHNFLLKNIPPGSNYLYYTEKRGYPNPIFKWKSKYWTFLLKLTPDRPSWTIQASFSTNQGPFHWRNRFLRIEEIKRLQTIDDDYEITGEFKEQWRQVGNAVPPKLSLILAREILKQIKKGLK